MEKFEIKSVSEYLNKIESFEQQHIAQWLFRGQGNSKYDLIPGIFRLERKGSFTSWKELEEYMLIVFQREARPFQKIEPNDGIELLSLAQHYGLPTRLLDWSTNPLVALFFAVENYDSKSESSAVWCYGYYSTNNCHPISSRIDRKLTLEKENHILFPSHISPRITNQSGCFTIHNLPDKQNDFIPFNKDDEPFGIFDQFIIKKEHRKEVLDQLYDLGYHHGLIYPGLDGISKRVKYEASLHKRCSNEKQSKRIFEQ